MVQLERVRLRFRQTPELLGATLGTELTRLQVLPAED